MPKITKIELGFYKVIAKIKRCSFLTHIHGTLDKRLYKRMESQVSELLTDMGCVTVCGRINYLDMSLYVIVTNQPGQLSLVGGTTSPCECLAVMDTPFASVVS